jgi:hypothetical protein
MVSVRSDEHESLGLASAHDGRIVSEGLRSARGPTCKQPGPGCERSERGSAFREADYFAWLRAGRDKGLTQGTGTARMKRETTTAREGGMKP